jgi:hypothetical protein
MTTASKRTIHQCMVAAKRRIDGLTKDNTSQHGNFKYRGVEDAYNYLHDILAEEGIFTVPRVIEIKREDRLSHNNKTLIYTILQMEYDFFAEDGSFITSRVIGESMDSGDKSANKSMSVAHKMALFQVFMIPTLLSADPDAETHTLASPGDTPAKPAQAIPMATPGQWKTLNDYRELGATTGEMNDYLDNKSTSLTAKQAGQLINKIEEGIGAEEKK